MPAARNNGSRRERRRSRAPHAGVCPAQGRGGTATGGRVFGFPPSAPARSSPSSAPGVWHGGEDCRARLSSERMRRSRAAVPIGSFLFGTGTACGNTGSNRPGTEMRGSTCSLPQSCDHSCAQPKSCGANRFNGSMSGKAGNRSPLLPKPSSASHPSPAGKAREAPSLSFTTMPMAAMMMSLLTADSAGRSRLMRIR